MQPQPQPGTRPTPVPYKPPDRNPLDELLRASRDGAIIRPVYLAATLNDDPLGDLVSPFVRLSEANEMEDDSNVSFKLLQNIALVLEDIDEEIAETSWPSLQDVLEEHTMAVVEATLPELHILSEIHVTSVAVHKNVRNLDTRNLEPTNGPYATIVYDTIVRFDQLSWTGEMLGINLVGLPFSDSINREAFVKKLKNRLGKDEHPWMENLVGVSYLITPPTKEGVVVETPIVFSSQNYTETKSAVEFDVVDSTSNDTPDNSIETRVEVEDKNVPPPPAQTTTENDNQTTPVVEIDIDTGY